MNQGKLDMVKREMARVNISILGIHELKWTGMGGFNSYNHYISYCGQESHRRNGVALIVNKRVQNAVLGCNLKYDRMISVHFQGKIIQHHSNPSLCPHHWCCSKDCLCDSHSVRTVTAQQLHSPTASNASPLSYTVVPMWTLTPISVPPPPRCRSSPAHTPLYPPTSFILLSFAWFCIFSSSGQVLLSTLSWRSARSFVSEDVFLMNPWREMYSTSAYSSAILLFQKYLKNNQS